MPLFEYNKWENIHKVIKRARKDNNNLLNNKKGVSLDTLFINIYKHSQYNYYS